MAKKTKEMSEVYEQEQLNLHQKRWQNLRLTWIDYKKGGIAVVDLGWLWTNGYGLFWLYINTQEQFSLFGTNINVFTGFMISWNGFIFCSIYSVSTKSMTPNGNISMEQDKVLSFVWKKVLFYREVKFFY